MAAKAKQADAEIEERPEEEVEEGEQPAAKSKLKLKLPSKKVMIIAAAGLLVIAGGGAGAYLFLGGSGHDKMMKVQAKPATFVNMPDVLVNLASTGSDRTQYLKVKIVLELPNVNEVQQIQPLMPRVMDAFQTYLRRTLPAQGGIDSPRQRCGRAQPYHRRSVQGDRRPVTT